jgi:hypothetical protein
VSCCLAVIVPLLAAYVPFLRPLPVWDYWPLLLLPLVAAVAIVYKCVKCAHVRQVPREAASIALWIVLGMTAAAAAIAGATALAAHAASR